MADLFIEERLTSPAPVLFCWAVLPGAHQAEIYGRSRLDAVLVDMQHGLIGYSDMLAMVQAVQRAGKPAFVRPPLDDFGMVSRALDAGAAAIVMPMINTVSDARRLVEAAKYPPVGGRSFGPVAAIHASGLDGPDYLHKANGLTKVFGMIETAEALSNLDEICAVEDIDGVFIGPYDLSISLSKGEMAGAHYDGVQKALPIVVAAANKAGIVPGIYASSREQVRQYTELGFRFISVAGDTNILNAGLDQVLATSEQAI